MEAHARSLTFLEKESRVKIPFFQRPYVWDEENWSDLLDDLLDFDKNQFLGSLVLKQMPRMSGEAAQVLVIDGQQRLTTLSIIIRALYNCCGERIQRNWNSDIDGLLFYKERRSDDNFHIKIEHSKIDRENYRKVIQNEIDHTTIKTGKGTSKILCCYKYFMDTLAELPEDTRIDLFDKLCDKDNHIIVVIDLKEDDDEQTIFDTINSAGVRLSGADIIKNALFQRAIDIFGNQEEVEVLYKEAWEDIFAADEQTIAYWAAQKQTGRLMRDNIEILLHSIAVIEGFFDLEKHKLSDLSNIYKAHIAGLDLAGLTSFTKSIAEYARLYRDKIAVFESSDLFGYEDYEKRLFHILNVCDVSTFHPYILYLYRTYKEDEAVLKTALHKLETLVVRRYICNSETKHYNKLCRDFINDGSKVDALLAEIEDATFAYELGKVNNKPATLLLFWVELYRRHNEARYIDKTDLKYSYSLEHIMPQKWEEYWSDVPIVGEDGAAIADPEAAKQYRYKMIYNIGNMTLLKSSLNTSLRNYEFERKVNGDGSRKRTIKDYAELGITRLDIVAPYEQGKTVWDEERIRARGKKLTDDILKIWS